MIEYFARQLWASLLWLMRRRWMRNLQARSVGWLPESRRAKALANIYRQNRFARRIGLPLMRITVFIVFASVMTSLIVQTVLDLRERGVFDLKNGPR